MSPSISAWGLTTPSLSKLFRKDTSTKFGLVRCEPRRLKYRGGLGLGVEEDKRSDICRILKRVCKPIRLIRSLVGKESRRISAMIFQPKKKSSPLMTEVLLDLS
jgi:hypothetical protein